MSLNPGDDILTQIIKSYEGYADLLRGQERKEFDEMLRLCYRYAEAINAKGEPFPEEAVIMTLLLKAASYHQGIEAGNGEALETKG